MPAGISVGRNSAARNVSRGRALVDVSGNPRQGMGHGRDRAERSNREDEESGECRVDVMHCVTPS